MTRKWHGHLKTVSFCTSTMVRVGAPPRTSHKQDVNNHGHRHSPPSVCPLALPVRLCYLVLQDAPPLYGLLFSRTCARTAFWAGKLLFI